jgi:hypothetical protein
MSNTIKKEFSQDIEKELEDFNNNFSPKKEFSQDENKKNFDNLEYNEKNQRIIQKEYLFDWIISICNKFLIGVSLVFCMFMFEFKNDLIETENFFNLVYLVFLIIILCLVFFLNFGKRLYKFFLRQLEIYPKLKKNKEEQIEEKAAKATIKLIKIIFYTTAIAFFYLSINKIFIVRHDIKEVQSIIIALITSTTSTVIGLPAIVAMAIFRSEKKKKKDRNRVYFD